MDQPETDPASAHHQSSFSLLGAFKCPTGSPLGRFLQRCLDTSITGKLIGILVVSLLGFALLIAFNRSTLHSIDEQNHVIKDIAIPRYKISQYILRSINGFKISLIQLLDKPELKEGDPQLLANEQRLSDMDSMLNALQHGGPVQDMAKVAKRTLDTFTVQATDDPKATAMFAALKGKESALAKAYQSLTQCLLTTTCADDDKDDLIANLNDSLDDLYAQVVNLAADSSQQQAQQSRELVQTIATSNQRSLLIGLVIAMVLTIATLLYILIIATPLRSILEKITFIAQG